tara:strand:+ start:54 stop:392 length:339 start_codon:yes stop_codon:yes gene_type:complete
MYKIRGKIIDSRNETIKLKDGENAKKMYITIEETDTGFNHKHQFEIFGETKINLFKDKIKKDRYVKIDFYIKSNAWKDKFFNTLNIKDIRLEDDIVIPEQVYDNTEENDTPF